MASSAELAGVLISLIHFTLQTAAAGVMARGRDTGSHAYTWASAQSDDRAENFRQGLWSYAIVNVSYFIFRGG